MKTTPISLKPEHQSDGGMYFVYFWVGTITRPAERWEPVSPRIMIIWDLTKAQAPGVTANLHLAPLRDISSDGTVKLQMLPAGTRREDAEKWIDTPEGKAWSAGVVGGSLCAIAIAIPK
jgi:hypothetical protein